jgi:AhpD family alkylhydroperoxidase
MNKREFEIASIAASIASGCLPCLEYHKTQSLELGIDLDEIFEICNIALNVRTNAYKHNRMKIDYVLNGKSNSEGNVLDCDFTTTNNFDCDC